MKTKALALVQEAPRYEDECLGQGMVVTNTRIAESIDILVDYLLDNHVEDIYALILGEVEKRLMRRTLQRTRGNKLQAAKLLGISRNTMHRKMRELSKGCGDALPTKQPLRIR